MMKTAMSVLLAMAMTMTACGGDDKTEDTTAAGASDTTEEAADPVDEVAEEVSDEEPEASTTTTSTPETTEAGAAPQAQAFSLYDFRYCEILMTVTDETGNEITEVWGTPGVDPCTDEAWYALDPDAIQAENEASFIEMNGPRYFVVDGTADTGDGAGGTGTAAGGEAMTRQFGDITMSLLATADVSEESQSYVPDLVARTTTWTFEAGTEIYELTDPEGNVYVMQSYSRIVNPTLTAEDLPTLDDQLDLPEGWAYGARVLDEALQVALAPDGAFVVQDDLRNSYQRNG